MSLIATGRLSSASESTACPHCVQFYSDDSVFLGRTADFLGQALLAGSPIVVIATEQHRQGLQTRLEARGLDIAAARQHGSYIALDASETLAKFMAGDEPNAELFETVVGAVLDAAANAAPNARSQVTAFGEMVALLFERGKAEAAIRLEQLWNQLARLRSFSLYCGYPMRSFSRHEHGTVIARICAEHSHVIPAENYSTLTENDRFREVAQLQQKAQALEAEVAVREQLANEVEQRKRAEENLAHLSVQLMKAQDEERRRIARELHDSLGQFLVALQMNLDLMENCSDEERRGFHTESSQLVSHCLKEVRTLSYLLHPPNLDDMGLVSAIAWYANGFSKRSGIRVALDLPNGSLRLPPSIEMTLFRILQEALTNIHRHAHSPVAEIRLAVSNDAAILEIRDEGKGIGPEILEAGRRNKGVGIVGMRGRIEELRGSFEIASTKNGTRLLASIPLHHSCDSE